MKKSPGDCFLRILYDRPVCGLEKRQKCFMICLFCSCSSCPGATSVNYFSKWFLWGGGWWGMESFICMNLLKYIVVQHIFWILLFSLSVLRNIWDIGDSNFKLKNVVSKVHFSKRTKCIFHCIRFFNFLI